MKKILSLICLVLCISCCFSCGNASESSDTENKSDGNTSGTEIVNTDSEKNDSEKEDKMRLGAYVWYGFSYEGNHYTDRLITEFAGREPIWGWTEDSLSNMAYQIQIAKEYGLSFFAFDWYYGHPELNQAVMNFSRAEGQEDMEFCLMVANHDGARITYDTWKDACNTFIRYMSKKNALKVNGKPVIIFYDITNLVTDLGGTDKVRECFDYLRAQTEAYGGAYIIGCECPYGTPSTGAIDFNYESFSVEALQKRLSRDKECGFDALTGYNYRRYSPIEGSYELSYQTMTQQHEISWDAISEYSDLAYAPCILSGWDCRPWETDWSGNTTGYRSCYAPDRTAEVFTQHILNAYQWLQDNPEQSAGNIALVYAWDEVCEGGFLIPTKGEGFKMLEGLKNAVDQINNAQ